jgi:hypothetical protein
VYTLVTVVPSGIRKKLLILKSYHANAIAHAGKIVAEHANVLWVQARSKS